MSKKGDSRIEIFDATGRVVCRAHVKDPKEGLRGANLEGLTAPLGQLQGLDLSGANLYWASLGNADLSFANLSNTDLRGASLTNAICRNANFKGANLGLDNLNGRTNLRGADLSGSDLAGANLKGALYDDSTRFPLGFDPKDHDMIHASDVS